IPKAGRLQLFDPNVFELPAVGSRGALGRNVIIGPGLVSFDPSLVKFFYLNSDRTRSVQFRAELFNVFNLAKFAIPTRGKLTVFNSPIERNTTAWQITQTSAPGRQIQFAVRIAF